MRGSPGSLFFPAPGEELLFEGEIKKPEVLRFSE
jgi:hypothetical protein